MRIDIVSTGLSRDNLTLEGQRIIAASDLLIGPARLIGTFAAKGQPRLAASRPDEVVDAIGKSQAARIAVLMSGDVGFQAGATMIASRLRKNHADADVRLIPGVSAVAMLATRVGVPWQDACLVSCHTSTVDLVAPVRRHRFTIALTSGNVHTLATSLGDAGYGGLRVWAGQNLGLEDESIIHDTVAGLMERDWSPLTTVLIENREFDDRVVSGLPDDRFIRGEVPMTHATVRAVSMARLAVRPTDVCYDIGCGTGSATVELALAAHAGHVYGLDKDLAAVLLTEQNCRTFHLGNVTALQGKAPDDLADWPTPDVAFVGGTSGSMRTIVETLVARNPAVRMVIATLAIENTVAAIEAMKKAGLTPQITQLNIADGQVAGGWHYFAAQNPITLIAGGTDD
ncbi:MAG: precorrin-6y C5,15-methyltransferase (decarboxylating) subunit CbiE [Propionibacteriaceae bacterium]|nr:precorrin-6y C5,15-methyltransferase (decarboxylating) subunit CbiE [Propionibacteriaceae bacterium]